MKLPAGLRSFRFSLFASIFLAVSPSSGDTQKRWETKPYTEWSSDEVQRMLHDSPWVTYSPAPTVITEDTQSFDSRGNPANKIWKNSASYVIRILTAKPLREAYLRQFSLSKLGIAVDAKRLQEEKAGKGQADRLQSLIQANPNDVLVIGDREHIVVRISHSVRWQAQQDSRFARGDETPLPDDLRELRLADLTPYTSLATDAKKLVLPVHCEYESYMAVLIYFPRVLPDGRPLIAKGDKKLRFKARFRNSKVTAEFDLQKMVWQGQIET
jgi:hypothetical protein